MREKGPITIETGPKHECGLVAIALNKLPDEPIKPAPLHTALISGLTALNHRGQEAAGLVWTDGRKFMQKKGLGLVASVFSDEVVKTEVEGYPPFLYAIGHSRYSTVDRNNIRGERKSTQPFWFPRKDALFPFRRRRHDGKVFALAHNGTVHFDYPLKKGDPQSDTYRVGKAILEAEGNFEESVIKVLSTLEGAYTFFFATPDGLYVARDPWGFRPCKVGRLNDGNKGFVLASETVAIDKMGGEYMGDIRRGTFHKITGEGLAKPIWVDPRKDGLPSAYCSFEHAYFAEPASIARDKNPITGVEEKVTNDRIRTQLGQRLGERLGDNIDFDVVMEVPKSGRSYAEGLAHATNRPTDNGIQENRYQFRSFIKGQLKEERQKEASLKINLIEDKIRGKRIGVVEDSIVRGHTASGIVLNLLAAGAESVHLFSGVPPIKAPCYWGIDFKHPDELIYHMLMSDPDRTGTFEERLASWLVKDDPELAKRVKVTFQTVEDYVSIIRGVPADTHHLESGACFHCVTGDAPTGTNVPVEIKVNTLFKTGHERK